MGLAWWASGQDRDQVWAQCSGRLAGTRCGPGMVGVRLTGTGCGPGMVGVQQGPGLSVGPAWWVSSQDQDLVQAWRGGRLAGWDRDLVRAWRGGCPAGTRTVVGSCLGPGPGPGVVGVQPGLGLGPVVGPVWWAAGRDRDRDLVQAWRGGRPARTGTWCGPALVGVRPGPVWAWRGQQQSPGPAALQPLLLLHIFLFSKTASLAALPPHGGKSRANIYPAKYLKNAGVRVPH